MSLHYKETKFGFEYGKAKVTRTISNGKSVWITIDSGKEKIHIRVTEKGKVIPDKRGVVDSENNEIHC